MKAVYVRWSDACHGMDEVANEKLGGLVELHEVAWLVKETEESITLSMEYQKGVKSSRLWLTIPRVNIIEIREVKIGRKRNARAERRR